MPLPKNRKLVRRLHDVRIDEVSAVDKSAGVGTKIMLRKSASIPNAAMNNALKRLAASVNSIVDDPDCDKNTMLAKTFAQYQDHLNMLMKRYPKNANLDVAVDEAGDDEGMPDDATRTERLGDDADADDEKEKEAMAAKLKSLDAVQICKQMVDEEHAFAMSEHELVDLIDGYAKAHGSSFAKLFEQNNPEGLAIRQAITIAKNAQFLSRTSTLSKQQSSSMFHAGDEGYFTGSGKPGRATLTPTQVGGRDARAPDNPRRALDQLNELAAEQRRQNKTLSESGAFAQVYTDPKNAALAQREREENRPVATGW